MISYATLKSMVNEFEFNTWWVIRSPAAHKSASISSNKYTFNDSMIHQESNSHGRNSFKQDCK